MSFNLLAKNCTDKVVGSSLNNYVFFFNDRIKL